MDAGSESSPDKPADGLSLRPFLLDRMRVEPATLTIERDGEAIRLEAKVMQVLLTLAEAGGEVVSRAELEKTVWAGRIVTDDSVTNTVVKLRKALGDKSRDPRVIETIAKRGYRLMVEPVFEQPQVETEGQGEQRTWPRLPLALGLLAVLVGMLGIAFWMQQQAVQPLSPAATQVSTPSIVVMPLDTLGGPDAQRYFAEGITLDLITALARVPDLLVISPDTALGYRESDADDRTVGAETGVSYLVRGGVQLSGERLRINVRVIEVERGTTLWAGRFEGQRNQVFEIQDQIVAGIAEALRLQLGQPFEVARRDMVTRSIDAYDAFLLGQEAYGGRTPSDNREAQTHFERALSLDPTFARASAGLALTWSRQAMDGWTDDPEAALDKAIHFAEQASAIAPDMPQVHFVLGQVQLFRGHYRQAAAAASTAIELNPNYADAYGLLAWVLHYSGRPKQALLALAEARRHNPASSAGYEEITGEIHFFAGRYSQAVASFQDAVERNPSLMRARLWLAISYLKNGDLDQSTWEVEEVLAIHPEFSLAQLPRAFPLRDPRQLETLRQALHELGLPDH